MNVKAFTHDDWVKIWEGKWSFLSCAHFGEQYTKELRFGSHPFQDQSIMFCAHGRSSGWMTQKDRDRLGDYLSRLVTKDPRQAGKIATRLKLQAKDFLAFIKKREKTVCTGELYEEFWDRLLVYYHAHISVKYIVDYLDPRLLKKYLPQFQAARLAAESVLNRTEDFIIGFAKMLAKQTSYRYTSLLCLRKREIKDYFRTGILPKESVLQMRNKGAALLYEHGKSVFFVGSAVKRIEKIVHPALDASQVRGAIAFPGVASGIARIVSDPHKAKVFNRGDVLIAGSTRPEYLPLMRRAGAFVTDAGGILSHAAIVAREMKKPCVIGTKIATKIFKDGDLVEVDAQAGIVRKLKP